jgi:hypothetical protein
MGYSWICPEEGVGETVDTVVGAKTEELEKGDAGKTHKLPLPSVGFLLLQAAVEGSMEGGHREDTGRQIPARPGQSCQSCTGSWWVVNLLSWKYSCRIRRVTLDISTQQVWVAQESGVP